MTDVAFDYTPREQFVSFHQRNHRWAVLVCHRRAGKTVACVADLLLRAAYTKKHNARFAYIAPFYRQAKDVAWEYLKEMGADMIVKVRESQLRVELFNGAWITLYGADNPDALRGLYLDGVILDEYGDSRPSLWGTVVLPTLADRRGWAVFIGTAKGKNHFYDVHERSKEQDSWFSMTLKASDSGLLPQEELTELAAQMSADQYRQEMECDFTAAVAGTYYAGLIAQLEAKGQIALNAAPYDPELPVTLACDLGYRDSTAFWFCQRRPDRFDIVDYHEDDGLHVPDYLAMLDAKGYSYDRIYLPHDARAKTVATKRSTVEQFVDHFKDPHGRRTVDIEVVPKLSKQHGIDAARMMLPHCHFNSHKCKDGIEALRDYRRKYDEMNKCYSNEPAHTWSSHGADGFRYLALMMQQADLPAPTEVTPKVIPLEPTVLRLDDLMKERQSRQRGTTKAAKLRI